MYLPITDQPNIYYYLVRKAILKPIYVQLTASAFYDIVLKFPLM